MENVENPKQNLLDLLAASRDRAAALLPTADAYAAGMLRRHMAVIDGQIEVVRTGELPERKGKRK
jgi:hypothetical protein